MIIMIVIRASRKMMNGKWRNKWGEEIERRDRQSDTK